MRKQYLHLCIYRCQKCEGPVANAWLGIKENEISRETGIQQIGAICLACGHQQAKPFEENSSRRFAPVEWRSPNHLPPDPKPDVELVAVDDGASASRSK